MSEQEVPDGIYVEFAGRNGLSGVIRAFRRVEGRWYRLSRYHAGAKAGQLFELTGQDDAINRYRDEKVAKGEYTRIDVRGEVLR